MDFTKIKGKKTARFNDGDLVVCVFKGDNNTSRPNWPESMDIITGAVLTVDNSGGEWSGYSSVVEVNGQAWFVRPEWLIPAYDPENTLRLGEPVLYKYGRKVYLRTVKSMVGSYCELDNGSVFHHSKLFNRKRALAYVTWPALWSDCFGLGESWDIRVVNKFIAESGVFNRRNPVDNYNLSA